MSIIINPDFVSKKFEISIDEVSEWSKLPFNNKHLKGSVLVQGFKRLEELDLGLNYIEKFDIDEVSRTNLKRLDLGGNNFKFLNDCLTNVNLNSLTHLSINDNHLSLNLNDFKNFRLENLNLSNSKKNKSIVRNYIVDKDPILIDQLKLNIKNLNIDNTDVKDNYDLDDLTDEDSQSFQEESDINKSDNNYGFFSNFYHFIANYIAIMFSFLLIWWWKLIIFSIILFVIYKIFFSKIIRRKFTIRPILDTVKEVIPSKIYDIKSPRYNEEFWTIRCLNNTFRVYQDVIEDKKFLNSISNGTILGRQYIFIIKKGIRGKQIIRAEEFY